MYMTPIEYYEKQRQEGIIIDDEQQRIALNELQLIYANLLKEHKARSHFLSALRKPKLVPGLYLWGGVGIGKTFLMDCFFHSLPFKEKMRMHFHQFMQMIHQQLKIHQGKKNPLKLIANDFAKKTSVLCFDEFFVTDITDAMILARLLEALFAAGVCLVTTSNAKPDDLYKNGLQRKLFLPAIELLKTQTKVLHIPTTTDYRLRHLKHAGVFYHPNDYFAQENMEKSFALLAAGQAVEMRPLEIHGRFIPIVKEAGHVVWFDFNVICAIPRSQQDYLSIAQKYRTILISNIPAIPAAARDKITLFIRLIDVLYDQRTRLVASADCSIEQIYVAGNLLTEFARTRSRLLEMQSEAYFTADEL